MGGGAASQVTLVTGHPLLSVLILRFQVAQMRGTLSAQLLLLPVASCLGQDVFNFFQVFVSVPRIFG